MSTHFFPMVGRKPCDTCGVPEGVILNVNDTGFSCTSGFQHKPECPALRCEHGVPWQDDCETCEAARASEADEGY